MKRAAAALAWGLAISLWGCGDSAPGEAVVAIGQRRIPVAEFAESARRIYGEGTSVERLSPDEKRKVLDALIAAELLTREGLRRGLDRDPDVRQELDALARRLLLEAYYERDIWAGLEVSQGEVKRRYEERGSGVQIRLAHILCESQEAAEEVLAELAGGRDFAGLARAVSRHAETAPGGGDMGYLSEGTLPPAVLDAVRTVPAGQVHPRPISTRAGYHVVKVLGRRRQSLEEQRPALEQELLGEKKAAGERDVWNRLQQQYGLQWNPGVAARMARREELPEDQTLYRWQGGEFKAADYVRRAGIPQPVFGDSARIHRLAERLVMRELIHREAVEKGYGELESVRRQLAKKREERMAEKLFAQEFAAREIPFRQIRDFYERNREKYRTRTRVTVREILVDDLALADSLHALIRDGADMGDLARRFTRRSALKEGGGMWEDVAPKDPRSARIYRAALEGEGLLEPFRVPGGFSVVQVLDKREGELPALAEVEQAVRADIATVGMDAFIDSLRRRYADEIRVDEAWISLPAGGDPGDR